MYGLRCHPKSRRIFRLVLTLAVMAGVVFGGEISATEPGQTTITSKTLIAQGKARKAIFEGNVVLTQGDLVVRADRMVVFFKKPNHSESNSSSSSALGKKIDLIEAKGKVFIEKGDSKVTCGHAVYYWNEEKIVLTESPVAWQGGTRVSGPRMTMYLKDNRSVVEGGSRVLIFHEEEGGG